MEGKEGADADDWFGKEPLYSDIFETFCTARREATAAQAHSGVEEYLAFCSKAGTWPLKEVSRGLTSKEMDLSDLDMTVDETSALVVALRENERVETLRLTRNELGDSAFAEVCKSLEDGRVSKVRTLYAEGVGISDKSASNIVRAIKARTDLDGVVAGKCSTHGSVVWCFVPFPSVLFSPFHLFCYSEPAHPYAGPRCWPSQSIPRLKPNW